RRTCRGVQLRYPAQHVDRHIGLSRGTFERPLTCPFAELFGAVRVRVEEPLVSVSLLEQKTVNGERHEQVRTGPDRQMKVSLFGERRRPRIDDDEGCTTALRFANV